VNSRRPRAPSANGREVIAALRLVDARGVGSVLICLCFALLCCAVVFGWPGHHPERAGRSIDGYFSWIADPSVTEIRLVNWIIFPLERVHVFDVPTQIQPTHSGLRYSSYFIGGGASGWRQERASKNTFSLRASEISIPLVLRAENFICCWKCWRRFGDQNRFDLHSSSRTSSRILHPKCTARSVHQTGFGNQQNWWVNPGVATVLNFNQKPRSLPVNRSFCAESGGLSVLLRGFCRASEVCSLTPHTFSLASDGGKRENSHEYATNTDNQKVISGQTCRDNQAAEVPLRIGGGLIALLWGCTFLYSATYFQRVRRWAFIVLGGSLLIAGSAAFLFPPYYVCEQTNNQTEKTADDPSPNRPVRLFSLLFFPFVFHADIVPRKYFLTRPNYWGTVLGIEDAQMANILAVEKQVAVISALAEGAAIRQVERMTGVNRNTIMNLGVRVGKGCTALLDAKMRNLECSNIQMDELWGFIGKKQRHVTSEDSPELGDVWTFCAIDRDTKLVPSFKVGKRDAATANCFVVDLASRLESRVQLSTDALHQYAYAIELGFGGNVDYAQVVKVYEDGSEDAEVIRVDKAAHVGNPNLDLATTSHVERLNGTTRLHMRRLSRLTYAFSKKLENFEAAVGLHFAYYNLVKKHSAVRCTPAQAAGVERDQWTVKDLVEAAA
jgi:IS1 family transposase